MRIVHPTWRDEQLSGNYPFGDQATLVNNDGLKIGSDVFLDAHLYVIGAGLLYLSQVEITAGQVVLHVGDVNTPSLATATFTASTPTSTLLLLDQYQRPSGVLIADVQRLASISVWDEGVHSFTYEATHFATTCCLPMPQIGVRGIQLADGSLFTDIVWLVGSNGVVLRPENSRAPAACNQTDDVLPTIRMDVVGDPLFVRKLCAGLEFTAPRPVRKLRVHNRGQTFELTPDSHGNVFIQTGDALSSRPALRLREQPEGLVLEVLGTAIA